ncbi:MAG: type III secretion system outer membrane ring subunit SctC [Kiritimatiellae bacterium]|nr:type III secretion system outer membrane ring subunit SctC [Kiritimatiellia bacterium]
MIKKLIMAVAMAFAALAGAAGDIPWKLPAYTLVARNMDLRVALNAFAVAEGLSIVISDSVTGQFSGEFKDVPAGEFLEKLATVHNFTWYYDGAALYLYSAGEIRTLLLDLKYMKAGEVRTMLRELGVEDARFPIRTTSNDELILISGPPRYVAIVAETIAKADNLREARSFNEIEVKIFPLKHTWADTVSFSVSSPESTVAIKGIAQILDEIMNHDATLSASVESIAKDGADKADKPKAEKPENGPVNSFRPVIRAENRLNAVIVRDVKSRLPMYGELIRQLDVPQKLVEITVTVVELSQNDALDWQLSLALQSAHGHSDFGAGQNAVNIFEPAELAGMGFAGALTHIHSSYRLGASLTALRQKGKARNISRTTLLTVNNLAARMSDSQSYHARVVGTEVATLEEVTAGTDLVIKPRIIPSGITNVPDRVWLSMELDDGGFETVTVDSMPMTRTSTLQTQTAVFENDSIMLAGYLRDVEHDAGWGIPYLRDIPWIGWLFGGSSVSKETVQRMFIFTPHIVDIDAENLARSQAARLRDVVEAEMMQDDAAESDGERRLRKLERDAESDRRSEKADDRYRRREAELEHAGAVRKVERERERDRLDDDIRGWEILEEMEADELALERSRREARMRSAENPADGAEEGD